MMHRAVVLKVKQVYIKVIQAFHCSFHMIAHTFPWAFDESLLPHVHMEILQILNVPTSCFTWSLFDEKKISWHLYSPSFHW